MPAANSLPGYFFLRAAAARDFILALGLGLGLEGSAGSAAFGWSPIIPFSGHILKAGHFRQPATMAIGQTVMMIPFGNNLGSKYARHTPPKVVACD